MNKRVSRLQHLVDNVLIFILWNDDHTIIDTKCLINDLTVFFEKLSLTFTRKTKL